jgi:hypothetical protein
LVSVAGDYGFNVGAAVSRLAPRPEFDRVEDASLD